MAKDVSAEVMLAYYSRLYPFHPIYQWLNHNVNPTKLFTHREFAFNLPGDVYIRYNSFPNAEDFKKQVCSYNPTRFEIGPIYSLRPRDKKSSRPGAFVPLKRELVFDIDMTDYDSIRTCCKDASICKKCWGFIAAAVRILDTALRDQFGFEHLLWVYSGRRGIHLWISDKEAMELTDDERRVVVGWLAVMQGATELGKKINVRQGGRALPPSLQSALTFAAETFTDLILEEQDCFEAKEGYEGLLKLIPDTKVVNNLRTKWDDEPSLSSEVKWADFKAQIKKYDKGSAQRIALTNAMEDIILTYTYPRLDAEVSKHRNHLLKAPFCIHPGTGRVCVPVDPSNVDEFDPEAVPTVHQLLSELDSAIVSDSNTSQPDWEKTSLRPYVEMLNGHVRRLLNGEEKHGDLSW